MLATQNIDDNVVMMVMFAGIFVVVPICVCALALAGKINLQSLLQQSHNKCPHCGATRTGNYCARCGGRVDAQHRGNGS